MGSFRRVNHNVVNHRGPHFRKNRIRGVTMSDPDSDQGPAYGCSSDRFSVVSDRLGLKLGAISSSDGATLASAGKIVPRSADAKRLLV